MTHSGMSFRPNAKTLTKLPIILAVFLVAFIVIVCVWKISERSNQIQKQQKQREQTLELPPPTPKATIIPDQFREDVVYAPDPEPDPEPEPEPDPEPDPLSDLGNNNAPGNVETPTNPGGYYNLQPEQKTPEEIYEEQLTQQRLTMMEEARNSPLSVKLGAIAGGIQQTPGISSKLNPTTGNGLFPNQIPGQNLQPQLPPQYSSSASDHQDAKREFLKTAGEENFILENAYTPPISPFSLMQGHLIPITLITQINSDLPGHIKAMVTETVYDTATGNYALVPQGTMVNGIYDSKVVFGQKRILVAWQRLVFPDGSSLNLDTMPGVDKAGASGLKDIVNNHYVRIFGGAILMSVINAGFSYVADRGGSDNENESVSDAIAKSSASQMQKTFSSIMQKLLNIQPELINRTGLKSYIIVTKDIYGLKPYNPSTKPTYFLQTKTLEN